MAYLTTNTKVRNPLLLGVLLAFVLATALTLLSAKFYVREDIKECLIETCQRYEHAGWPKQFTTKTSEYGLFAVEPEPTHDYQVKPFIENVLAYTVLLCSAEITVLLLYRRNRAHSRN